MTKPCDCAPLCHTQANLQYYAKVQQLLDTLGWYLVLLDVQFDCLLACTNYVIQFTLRIQDLGSECRWCMHGTAGLYTQN